MPFVDFEPSETCGKTRSVETYVVTLRIWPVLRHVMPLSRERSDAKHGDTTDSSRDGRGRHSLRHALR